MAGISLATVSSSPLFCHANLQEKGWPQRLSL
jgi:hypothetical protein